MELRVLSGPQAGCRLPLGVGIYRAGADETCDVVLEGLPEHEIAFVIYVGQRSLGLESLTETLRLGGRSVSGLVPLAQGQVFEFGQWLFAVDDRQAPWPSDPELLRVKADSANGPVEMQSQHGDERGPPSEADAPVDASATAASLPDETPGNKEVAPSPASDVEIPATPRRRKVPFWVVGLAGTVAFLICGVMVLVMSLAPSQPAAAAGEAHRSVADELGKLAGAAGGNVKLEHAASGRLKLTGSVATRAEKLKLTREARVIEPAVLLQLTADEDLQTLARDALTQFPNSGVVLDKVHAGQLVLTGRVSQARLRDQIVAALWDGVPGLKAIDARVIAGDEVLTVLNVSLSEAGLTGRIVGELDPSDVSHLLVRGVLPDVDRPAWLDVRQKLEARFGSSLGIVEELHAPGAPPPPSASPSRSPIALDVVAVVRGPMPYALLRDGTKRELPVGAPER